MIVKKYINGRPLPTEPTRTATPSTVKKTVSAPPKKISAPPPPPNPAPVHAPQPIKKSGCGCGKK